MTTGDADGADDVDGLALEEAVDAVVAAEDGRDRDEVRSALERVSDDGIVRRSATGDAIEELTEAVTTARNAVNAAAMECRKLEDAAVPVQDVDVVAVRVGEFRADMERLVERVDDLGERLESLEDRAEDPDSLRAFATDVEAAAAEADDLGSTATRLSTAINDFVEWVSEPEVWVNELQHDLGALEDTVETVEAVVDELEAAAETGDDVADAVDDDRESDAADVEDPGATWLDATLRIAVVDLMIEDVRLELSGLQEVADRGVMDDDWYPDLVMDDLEELADRREAVAARLDELAEPAWTERFDERLTDFDAAFDGTEPPVDWTELQATLETYRLSDGDQQ